MLRSLRKAAASMLGFIIGISILAAILIPLSIYLSNMGSETLTAVEAVRDFESQRSQESVDIVYWNGYIQLKNTGSVPIAVSLIALDVGNGCGWGAVLYKADPMINVINPGDMARNISGYDLSVICYILTTRGNMFPVKEKYFAMLSQLSQGVYFTPGNTRFAGDIDPRIVSARFSTNDGGCSLSGTPAVVRFSQYNRSLLTINYSGSPVLFSGPGSSCFSLTFNNAVEVNASSYAVAVFYKMVFLPTSRRDTFGAALTACLSGPVSSCSSSSGLSWSPSSINQDYIVFEGFSLIPMGSAPRGNYSLTITLVFSIQGGGTSFYTGLEYIAVQGARLIAGCSSC